MCCALLRMLRIAESAAGHRSTPVLGVSRTPKYLGRVAVLDNFALYHDRDSLNDGRYRKQIVGNVQNAGSGVFGFSSTYS
jgi:hypothetical protein